MPDKPVLLVDSYAQIYRSFHAVRELTAADGTPVNAVFAMTRFLLKLEQDHPSAFGAFVFDKGKPPKRMALLPDYKANRPPMPDSLRAQLPVIRELIGAFGWPSVEFDGCEADDLLASIASALTDREIVIFSADKDLAQIVDDRVTMMVPEHTGGFSKRGVGEVRSKFEVEPSQIADYLALLGDSADNIPGVDGVGPKTAAQLLSEFGSGEKIYESLDRIPRENLRRKLEESRARFLRNVKLVKLDPTPPEGTVWKVENLRRRSPDWARIALVCSKLGLRSILKDLPVSAPAETPAEDDLFAPVKSVPAEKSAPEKKKKNDYEQMSLL